MATTTTTKPTAGAGAGAATLEVQHQIRANAAQLQDYFSDLYAWEKSVNQEEEARKKARAQQTGAQVPLPRPRASVGGTASNPATTANPQTHPAAHTYDKGYNKWAKFDVVRLLCVYDARQQSVRVVSFLLMGRICRALDAGSSTARSRRQCQADSSASSRHCTYTHAMHSPCLI